MEQTASRGTFGTETPTQITTRKRLTPIRAHVLSHVEDAAQSHRIARRLGISTTSVQSALQWSRLEGLVEYAGSRWKLTDLGKATVQSSGL